MTAVLRLKPLTQTLVLTFTALLSCTVVADSVTCSDPQHSSQRLTGVAHTVTVDGHPFALWSKTPAAPKAAVLLVHGRTWSGRPDFDLNAGCEELSLMNGLVDAGYAAFALDMRGYGNTPRDATGWLTPNRAAADLAGVLKWLNTQAIGHGNKNNQNGKAHLFGWSYGSTMAQLMVQQHPELAATLTLFGYPVRKGYSTTPADFPDDAPARQNTRANAISDFITPNSISPAAIDAFAVAALTADPFRVDWRELEQWAALDARKVRVPTLLLRGEFDPLAKKRVHRKLFRRLNTPAKRYVVIKGGDHAAFMEAPRSRFISEFSQFLDEQTPNQSTNHNTNRDSAKTNRN